MKFPGKEVLEAIPDSIRYNMVITRELESASLNWSGYLLNELVRTVHDAMPQLQSITHLTPGQQSVLHTFHTFASNHDVLPLTPLAGTRKKESMFFPCLQATADLVSRHRQGNTEYNLHSLVAIDTERTDAFPWISRFALTNRPESFITFILLPSFIQNTAELFHCLLEGKNRNIADEEQEHMDVHVTPGGQRIDMPYEEKNHTATIQFRYFRPLHIDDNTMDYHIWVHVNTRKTPRGNDPKHARLPKTTPELVPTGMHI